jgi:uncharacterized protein (DUF2236 family)
MSTTTSDDVERLRAATEGRTLDPTIGLFTPESVVRRVNREAVLLLGGGRALLLQVAHPLVAAGVAAHSHFRRDPFGRLWRTLDLMLTIVFGDLAQVAAAVRAIETVHARVHGVLEADTGRFPRGTPYAARDPELLLWVHATLVDSALLVFERFVAPLDLAARSAYYEESKAVGRLLGIPDRVLPRGPREFRDYMAGMAAGDLLAIGEAGQAIAASILRPPVTPVLAPAFAAGGFFAIGLLPSLLRERYGLAWDSRRERLLGFLASCSRVALPWLPPRIRLMPHARRAAARAGRPRDGGGSAELRFLH